MDHLSYTGFSSYLKCPRSYMFRYVFNRQEDRSWPLIFGGAMHSACAAIVQEDLTVTEAVEHFQEAAEHDLELWLDPNDMLPDERKAMQEDRRAAGRILAAYKEDERRLAVPSGSDAKADSFRMVEVSFDLAAPSGHTRITGRMDKVYREGDFYVISDLKTTSKRSVNKLAFQALYGHQSSLYAWAACTMFDLDLERIIAEQTALRLLPDDPIHAHFRRGSSLAHLEGLWSDIADVADAIRAGRFPRNIETGPCAAWGLRFCSFSEECLGGMTDGGSQEDGP